MQNLKKEEMGEIEQDVTYLRSNIVSLSKKERFTFIAKERLLMNVCFLNQQSQPESCLLSDSDLDMKQMHRFS
jgi:hypothetical protein